MSPQAEFSTDLSKHPNTLYSPVPSAGPVDVVLVDVTATSISFQWGPVPCIHRNGALVGYVITHSRLGGMEETTDVSPPGDGGMFTISGLEASVTYSVRIAAENQVGQATNTSGFVILTHGRYAPLITCEAFIFLTK